MPRSWTGIFKKKKIRLKKRKLS